MAVNINTKFFETTNNQWHTLSKIVFTSPNLTSPNTAGVRSHVLPGRGTLGLWYEDTSHMYRIMHEQAAFVSGTQDTYIGILSIYAGQEFDFSTDNSILIDVSTPSGTIYNTGDKVYYNSSNYGTIGYKTALTVGVEYDEVPSITIVNSDSNTVRRGLSYTLYWETTGIYTDSLVNVAYSLNAGVDWVYLASGVENSGEYLYTINDLTSQGQLKVEWSQDTSVDDTSAIFSVIDGYINILKPASTDVLETRIPQRVWWNSEDFFREDLVNVSLSINAGIDWLVLATGIANVGYADVNIPINYNSESVVVKVYTDYIYDNSSTFTAYTAGCIDVIYPDESSLIIGNGNYHRIWWNSPCDAFYADELVSILMSIDCGDTWETLASGVINSGYYDVFIPETTTTTADCGALFKVGYHADVAAINGISDFSVSVVSGSLSFVYPTNSGISFTNGENADIWWNSDYIYSDSYVNSYLFSFNDQINTTMSTGIYGQPFIECLKNTVSGSYSSIFESVNPIVTNYQLVSGVMNVLNDRCGSIVDSFVNSSINNKDFIELFFTDIIPGYDYCWSQLLVDYVDNSYFIAGLIDRLCGYHGTELYAIMDEAVNGSGFIDDLSDSISTELGFELLNSGINSSEFIVSVSDAINYVISNGIYGEAFESCFIDALMATISGTEQTYNLQVLSSGINNGHNTFLVDTDVNNSSFLITQSDGDCNNYTVSENAVSIEDPYLTIISPSSGVELRVKSTFSDTQHGYKVWWNTNIPTNKLLAVSYSRDGGTTWESISSAVNNTGYSVIDKVAEALSINCLVKLVYVNDAGETTTEISDTFSVIERIGKIENSYIDNFNLEASWATCSYNGVSYFYNADDNKLFRLVDNTFVFVVEFTEGVIQNPMIAVKDGNYYIASSTTKAVYEYLIATSRWRVLSSMPGRYGFSSAGDHDEYLYCIGDDNYWYKFSTQSYGEWEQVKNTSSITGEMFAFKACIKEEDNESYFRIFSNIGATYTLATLTSDQLDDGLDFSDTIISSGTEGYNYYILRTKEDGKFNTATPYTISTSGTYNTFIEDLNYSIYDYGDLEVGTTYFKKVAVISLDGVNTLFPCIYEGFKDNPVTVSGTYTSAAAFNALVLGTGITVTRIPILKIYLGTVASGRNEYLNNYKIYDTTDAFNRMDYAPTYSSNLSTYKNFFGGGINLCCAPIDSEDLNLNYSPLSTPDNSGLFYIIQYTPGSVSFSEIYNVDIRAYSYKLAFTAPYKDIYCNTIYNSNKITSSGTFSTANNASSVLTYFYGGHSDIYDCVSLEYNSFGEASGNNHIAYIGKATTFRGMNSRSLLINRIIYVPTGQYSTIPMCMYNIDTGVWDVAETSFFSISNLDVGDKFYSRDYDVMCSDGHNIYKMVGYEQKEFYKYEIGESVFNTISPVADDSIVVVSGTVIAASGIINYVINSGTIDYTIDGNQVNYSVSGYDMTYTEVEGSSDSSIIYSMISGTLNSGIVNYNIPTYFIEYSQISGSLNYSTLSGTLTYSFADDMVYYGTTPGTLFYNREEAVVALSPCTVSLSEFPDMVFNTVDNSAYLLIHNDAVVNLWKYDVYTNSWVNTYEFPFAVDEGHLCSVNEYIYIIEGGNASNRVLRYNVNTEAFVEMTSRPEANSDYSRELISTATDGSSYIYILVKNSYIDTKIYRYSIVSNTWDLFLKYSDVLFNENGYCSIMVDDDYIYNVVNYSGVSGTDYIVNGVYDGIYINKLVADTTIDMPITFISPPSYRQLTQPVGWEAPPTKEYYEDAPSGWVTPPIRESLALSQPTSWSAPISEVYNQTVPSGIVAIADGKPVVQTPYATQLGLVNVVGDTVIDDTNELYCWGVGVDEPNTSVNIKDSILFEITTGECYNCRLTAWDDITHTSLTNEMLMTDRARITACAFSCYNTVGDPYDPQSLYSFIFKPVVNQKVKGNIYYYGDFDLSYKYRTNVYGDYVIFMPYLADVDETISYGVHDFLITLHYSYT